MSNNFKFHSRGVQKFTAALQVSLVIKILLTFLFKHRARSKIWLLFLFDQVSSVCKHFVIYVSELFITHQINSFSSNSIAGSFQISIFGISFKFNWSQSETPIGQLKLTADWQYWKVKRLQILVYIGNIQFYFISWLDQQVSKKIWLFFENYLW